MTSRTPSDVELVEEFLEPVETGDWSPEDYAEYVEGEFGEVVIGGRRIRQMVDEGWSRINSETRRKLKRYLGYEVASRPGGTRAPDRNGDG